VDLQGRISPGVGAYDTLNSYKKSTFAKDPKGTSFSIASRF